ncbi:hypothetical protein ACIRRH_43625, partial [Kitasatospora sp. NPDC101235]|uniref:hypothetical protein n=1 Tax=Kitasatospora sp. NPDC101235 TaxID=3364101 RepID=UPI0037F4F140
MLTTVNADDTTGGGASLLPLGWQRRPGHLGRRNSKIVVSSSRSMAASREGRSTGQPPAEGGALTPTDALLWRESAGTRYACGAVDT